MIAKIKKEVRTALYIWKLFFEGGVYLILQFKIIWWLSPFLQLFARKRLMNLYHRTPHLPCGIGFETGKKEVQNSIVGCNYC